MVTPGLYDVATKGAGDTTAVGTVSGFAHGIRNTLVGTVNLGIMGMNYTFGTNHPLAPTHEFSSSERVGGAIGEVSTLGSAVNALRVGLPALAQRFGSRVTKETNYLYRGVSAKHPALSSAKKGDVTPGNVNGTVTPDMHNAGGYAANSPFTSWTRDPNIAAQHAAKHGDGGVILRVPQGAPPKGSKWSWEWSPDIYGEQEVLMRGARSGVEVLK